jgi:TRAP-type C4-dicarboxylate transport system permease large subunit
VGEIFRASVPYWIGLLGVVVSIAVFPQVATWLPTLAFSAK